MFEGFDFTNFWHPHPFGQCDPCSDELIREIESELGYKLPESYLWLIRQHNGGTLINEYFRINEPVKHLGNWVQISLLYGIGRGEAICIGGTLGHYCLIEDWGYPNIGVAVGDGYESGHDAIFLDYRECGPQGEPKVVHIDQEFGYAITPVADTFEEFIRGLVSEDEFLADSQ